MQDAAGNEFKRNDLVGFVKGGKRNALIVLGRVQYFTPLKVKIRLCEPGYSGRYTARFPSNMVKVFKNKHAKNDL